MQSCTSQLSQYSTNGESIKLSLDSQEGAQQQVEIPGISTRPAQLSFPFQLTLHQVV